MGAGHKAALPIVHAVGPNMLNSTWACPNHSCQRSSRLFLTPPPHAAFLDAGRLPGLVCAGAAAHRVRARGGSSYQTAGGCAIMELHDRWRSSHAALRSQDSAWADSSVSSSAPPGLLQGDTEWGPGGAGWAGQRRRRRGGQRLGPCHQRGNDAQQLQRDGAQHERAELHEVTCARPTGPRARLLLLAAAAASPPVPPAAHSPHCLVYLDVCAISGASVRPQNNPSHRPALSAVPLSTQIK